MKSLREPSQRSKASARKPALEILLYPRYLDILRHSAMFCSQCGRKAKSEDAFCGWCGLAIPVSSVRRAATPRVTHSENRFFKYALIAVQTLAGHQYHLAEIEGRSGLGAYGLRFRRAFAFPRFNQVPREAYLTATADSVRSYRSLTGRSAPRRRSGYGVLKNREFSARNHPSNCGI
jgi:hypothetical protein